jgi:hypothetical protein
MKKLAYLLMVVALFAVKATTQEPCQLESPDKPKPQEKVLRRAEIPASVHEVHSRLFKNPADRILMERDFRAGGVGISRGRPTPFFDNEHLLTSKMVIDRLVCSSDLVAIVRINGGQSSFTSDRGSVFTDYLANVEQLIKNDQSGPVLVARDIVIARREGAVELTPGNWVSVNDELLPRLEADKHYLVFLHKVQESGQYWSSGSEFTFVEQRLKPLDDFDPYLKEIAKNYTVSDLPNFSKCEAEEARR